MQWANWAGALSSAPQKQLLDLVFNKTAGGLGLNVVRYNIGGGSTDKSIMARYKYSPYMMTPGYLDSPGGVYNWSRDGYQRKILYGAIARGVNVVEAVAYSPPSWMTVSKDNEGSLARDVPNLDPSNYKQYATYLATVTAAFKTRYGVTFQALSIMNEAIEGWWVATQDSYQEGCTMGVPAWSTLTLAVSDALKAQGLTTPIAAFDSWVQYTMWTLLANVTRPAQDLVQQINLHTYRGVDPSSFPNDYSNRWTMNMVAKRLNKSKILTTSEWDPEIKEQDWMRGVYAGSQISMDINVLGVRQFSWFQAVGNIVQHTASLVNTHFTWNYVDPDNITINDMFYFYKQYTMWFVPGTFPIEVDVSCAAGLVAGYDPTNQRLILIVTNMLDKTLYFRFNFKEFKEVDGKCKMAIFRSSATEKYTQLASATVRIPGKRKLAIRPLSITTYVISGVALPASASVPTL